MLKGERGNYYRPCGLGYRCGLRVQGLGITSIGLGVKRGIWGSSIQGTRSNTLPSTAVSQMFMPVRAVSRFFCIGLGLMACIPHTIRKGDIISLSTRDYSIPV